MIRSNIDDVLGDLRETERAIPDAVATAIQDGAGDAVAALRDASPSRTGEFARSWGVSGTEMGAIIENRADYASFVDVDVAGAIADARIGSRIEDSINRLVG